MEWCGGAGGGAGQGRESVSIIVQQRGKLWVYGYCAFVLEISDFDVQAFNLSVELTMLAGTIQKSLTLSTYESCSLLTQADFLLLDNLRLVEIGHGILDIRVLLWIGLAGPVGLKELLNAVVSRVDYTAALLDDSIFGLDLLE